MSDPAIRAMSVEEYLRTELDSPVKREYVGGFVYPLHAQAGVSQEHSRITLNITLALGRDAVRSGCRLHTTDMRLYIAEQNAYYYPDVMLACGSSHPGRFFESAPCLLIEVLSHSTAAIDKVAKYTAYTALPSLQTYLIVEQDERRVYAYQRGPEGWAMREWVGAGDIPVPCLGTNLTLDDVYGKL